MSVTTYTNKKGVEKIINKNVRFDFDYAKSYSGSRPINRGKERKTLVQVFKELYPGVKYDYIDEYLEWSERRNEYKQINCCLVDFAITKIDFKILYINAWRLATNDDDGFVKICPK